MSEVIVYQAASYTAEQTQAAYNFSVIPQTVKKDGIALQFSAQLLKISRLLALTGVFLIIYAYGPSVWYWAGSRFGDFKANFILSQAEVQNLTADSAVEKPPYEPPFDPKLPAANHFSIPAIGVDTDIQEATLEGYEDALRKGVWRVTDFGAPTGSGKPVILAAHRFGYLAWTNSFRHKNSFFNLPKVKEGDVVSLVWRQRKYMYEVYATGGGTEISDYSADLILYTCETLTGKERIFVYARLILV